LYYMQDYVLSKHSFWNIASKYRNQDEKILLSELLPLKKRSITLWEDFERKSKRSVFEKYVCVMKGKERFKVASPIYRQNIFVGNIEGMQPDESPLDFFDQEHLNYETTKTVQFLEADLEAGDCLYVPAYFYIQSKTLCTA